MNIQNRWVDVGRGAALFLVLVAGGGLLAGGVFLLVVWAGRMAWNASGFGPHFSFAQGAGILFLFLLSVWVVASFARAIRGERKG